MVLCIWFQLIQWIDQKSHFSFIGKCIFASLIVSFRHGREEDEVMGISFKKELVVDRVQIHPVNKEDEKSKLQVHRL